MSSSTIEQALSVQIASAGVTFHFEKAPDTAAGTFGVYQLISDPHENNDFENKAGQAIFQFDVYSADRYISLQKAIDVRNTLQGFSGSMDGKNVIMVQCSWPRPFYSTDERIFRHTFDARVEYFE